MCIILVTGLPGVGKTTLIKRLSADLRKTSIQLSGFYTDEVRDGNGSRLGFDVITFNGQRSCLARTSESVAGTMKMPRVGKYSVEIKSFEKIVLPVFNDQIDLLIIDEIGKMEMLSRKFENTVNEFVNKLEREKKFLIATIPVRGNFHIVETMKTKKNTKIFQVTKQNRNSIYSEILQSSLNMLKIETA